MTVSKAGRRTLPIRRRDASGLSRGGMVEVRPRRDGKNSIMEQRPKTESWPDRIISQNWKNCINSINSYMILSRHDSVTSSFPSVPGKGSYGSFVHSRTSFAETEPFDSPCKTIRPPPSAFRHFPG